MSDMFDDDELHDYIDRQQRAARRPRRVDSNWRNTLWEMKDGTKIRIRDMEDGHLQNAIALLERSSPDLGAYPAFSPDSMAQYYAEQQWEAALEQGCDALPIYHLLCAEQEYRAASRAAPKVMVVVLPGGKRIVG